MSRYPLKPMRRYSPGYIPDAEAGPDFYYAVVRTDWGNGSISNCLHRHHTREAAQRCASRMVRDMRNPK